MAKKMKSDPALRRTDTKEFHLMRHRGRTMLAALVAVLALGVVASASASAALPEFSGTFPDTFEPAISRSRRSADSRSGVSTAPRRKAKSPRPKQPPSR